MEIEKCDKNDKLVHNLPKILQQHKFHPLNFMSPWRFISLKEYNKYCKDWKFYKFFSESQDQWYLLKISSNELDHETLFSEPEHSFTYQLEDSGMAYYAIWSIDYEATFL